MGHPALLPGMYWALALVCIGHSLGQLPSRPHLIGLVVATALGAAPPVCALLFPSMFDRGAGHIGLYVSPMIFVWVELVTLALVDGRRWLAHPEVNRLNAAGNAHLAKREYEEAIAEYTASISLDGRAYGVYRNRALAHLALGEHSLAAADCTAALQVSPGCSEAYVERGRAHHLMGDLDAALSDYAAAAHCQPTLANAAEHAAELQLLWAAAHGAKGNHEQAVAHCTKALAAKARSSEALLNRGWHRYRLKQYELAISDWTEAIGSGPDVASLATANRAQAYERMGDGDAARSDFETVIALCDDVLLGDPENAEAHARRGLALAKGRQDYEGALQELAQAVAGNHVSALVYYYRCWVLLLRGECDRAWLDYKRSCDAHPDPELLEALKSLSGREE